jgi:hypothetical protein
MNEDYKIKYMKISRSSIKILRPSIRGLRSFLFQSNEASVLDHIAPNMFSVYSVELELHDRNV